MAGKSSHHEDNESIALWQRAQLNPILRDYLYHIANERKCSPKQGARLKRMGVRSGVSDYHLPIARGVYHSLWVELKPDVKGYYPDIATSQAEWRKLMRLAGNAAFIIKGWEMAIAIMLRYLALEEGEHIISTTRQGQYDRF